MHPNPLANLRENANGSESRECCRNNQQPNTVDAESLISLSHCRVFELRNMMSFFKIPQPQGFEKC